MLNTKRSETHRNVNEIFTVEELGSKPKSIFPDIILDLVSLIQLNHILYSLQEQ
jgi:hypothetical protein